MSKDSLRGLVQLVSGLGDVTVARANQVARDLVNLTGLEDQLGKKKLAAQVQAISQEILKTAEANRAQVAALVRSEVESALGRGDVARLVDVDAAKASTAMLLSQVEELANRVRALVPGLGAEAPAAPAPVPTTTPATAEPAAASASSGPARKRPARRSFAGDPATAAPAKKTPAKKAPAKKAPAKKSPAKKAPSQAAAAAKSPAAKAATTRTPATKAAAKKAAKAATAAPAATPAKKATTRKTTAKKATGA